MTAIEMGMLMRYGGILNFLALVVHVDEHLIVSVRKYTGA